MPMPLVVKLKANPTAKVTRNKPETIALVNAIIFQKQEEKTKVFPCGKIQLIALSLIVSHILLHLLGFVWSTSLDVLLWYR